MHDGTSLVFVKTLVYHAAGTLMPYSVEGPTCLADTPHAYNGRAVHLGTPGRVLLPLGRETSITSPGSPSFRPHPHPTRWAGEVTLVADQVPPTGTAAPTCGACNAAVRYASKRNALTTTSKVEPSWNRTAVPMFSPKIVAGISTATTPRLT